ncbi:radical SAM protein [bacterium]|nr:radical SAM protein [bacterium]MBU1652604.1 radical SAM protein [bacterium]
MYKFKKVIALLKKGRFDTALSILCTRLGINSRIHHPPYLIDIEPTNACNLQCPTCITGSGNMNRPKRMMRLEEFKRIIDQVKSYAIDIQLYGYGEPFLNKELPKMIRYAVDCGLYVGTGTNGESFKDDEFCREVVNSGLHHVVICLDGADQETLSKYRVNSNFDDIVAGIQRMRQIRDSLKAKTPILEVQFITMKHNQHQSKLISDYAKKLGADVFCEKTVGINITAQNFNELAEKFLPDDLSKSRYEKDEDGNIQLKGEISNYCPRVYQSLVINSDGTVVPCCYDEHSDFIMGNVFESDLADIWRNEKYQAFRDQIKKDRHSIINCRKCSVGRYKIGTKNRLKEID